MKARISIATCLLLMAGALAAGCGDDTEQRVANERADAAADARIQEQMKDLESDVEDARERARDAERRAREAKRAAESGTTNTVVIPGNSPDDGRASGDWPGGSGYTAVLVSSSSRQAAARVQSQATARGLDAGVLYSSDYSSLRPGYWVVFSGSFTSQPDAARRAARAKDLGYPDSYPRFVSR